MIEIVHSDALEYLSSLEANSIDSIVTDAPAGVNFMGKAWDSHTTYQAQTDKGRGIVALGGEVLGLPPWAVGFCAFIADVFSEAHRVLKPGGHALVWALPRTADLTTLGLRAAGYEIRDVLVHLFGSGFPKSLNVSKSIDAHFGAEREVIGVKHVHYNTKNGTTFGGNKPLADHWNQATRATTPQAHQWEGYGTALKPGSEHWILCRKPLAKGLSVAKNVLTHGTGGLNIDGCRVANNERPTMARPQVGGRWPPNVVLTHSAECECVGTKQVKASAPASGPTLTEAHQEIQTPSARSWSGIESTPSYGDANGLKAVADWRCVEGCPVKEIGDQSGESVSSGGKGDLSRKPNGRLFKGRVPAATGGIGDKGTAARYYPQFRYVAKPSRAEREAGCGRLPTKTGAEAVAREAGSPGMDSPRAGAGRTATEVGNHHPTVKSIELMKWLCKLVTPPHGTCLDPFTGSGTTALAIIHLGEGRHFKGCEREADYVAIAKARVAHASPAEAIKAGLEDGQPLIEATGQVALF